MFEKLPLMVPRQPHDATASDLTAKHSPLLDCTCHGKVRGAVAGLVAQGPQDDAGVVAVAGHHAGAAVQYCCCPGWRLGRHHLRQNMQGVLQLCKDCQSQLKRSFVCWTTVQCQMVSLTSLLAPCCSGSVAHKKPSDCVLLTANAPVIVNAYTGTAGASPKPWVSTFASSMTYRPY
jgi:hypothetical protein